MFRKPAQGHGNGMNLPRISGLFLSITLAMIFPLHADAAGKPKQTFPRLGGYQIGATPYTGYDDPDYQRMMAKLDYVILSKGTELTNVYAQQIRDRNPSILLARYTNIVDISPTRENFQQERVDKLDSGVGPNNTNAKDWWARDYKGNITSNWPSMLMANITRFVKPDSNGDRWGEWAAKHYYGLWMDDPVWDAWFEDVVFYQPRTTESGAAVDWSGGKESSSSVINASYRSGHRAYWDTIKKLTPGKMIFVNHDWYNSGSPLPEYQNQVNGGLLEKVMKSTDEDAKGVKFLNTLEKYRKSFAFMRDPKIIMFVAQGEPNNYQFARYAFGTCLLNDGYFDYVPWDNHYGTVEWFDEYDLAGTAGTDWLGYAMDAPPAAPWKSGVWRREFQGGLVLVNPQGNGTKTVGIEPGFSRISGRQDRTTNNGQATTSVTLKEGDAIMLVRTDTQTLTAAPKRPNLTVN